MSISVWVYLLKEAIAKLIFHNRTAHIQTQTRLHLQVPELVSFVSPIKRVRRTKINAHSSIWCQAEETKMSGRSSTCKIADTLWLNLCRQQKISWREGKGVKSIYDGCGQEGSRPITRILSKVVQQAPSVLPPLLYSFMVCVSVWEGCLREWGFAAVLYQDNVMVFCSIVSIAASRANSVHRITANVLRDSSERPSGLHGAVFLQQLIILPKIQMLSLALSLSPSDTHIHTLNIV